MNLDDIRQKQSQQEEQQKIQQLETAVKQRFTKEALERYGNLKAAHPEKAMQLIVVLAQLMQNNNIESVDDNTMKQVLMHLNQKRDIKIKRI